MNRIDAGRFPYAVFGAFATGILARCAGVGWIGVYCAIFAFFVPTAGWGMPGNGGRGEG